jgi:hypothetical protein
LRRAAAEHENHREREAEQSARSTVGTISISRQTGEIGSLAPISVTCSSS